MESEQPMPAKKGKPWRAQIIDEWVQQKPMTKEDLYRRLGALGLSKEQIDSYLESLHKGGTKANVPLIVEFARTRGVICVKAPRAVRLFSSVWQRRDKIK